LQTLYREGPEKREFGSDFKSHSTSTCTSGAAGVQQHEESNSTNLPDFLSEDYVLANVLNDITNYEAHQNSVCINACYITILFNQIIIEYLHC
jgi:hypothetical protein